MEAAMFDMLLGNAIIYEGLLQVILPKIEATHAEFRRQNERNGLIRRIASRLGVKGWGNNRADAALLQPTGKCRVCEMGTQTSLYYSMVLVEMLALRRYQDIYEQSDGVCIAHLRMMLEQGTDEEGLEYVLGQTEAKLRKLASNLDALRESYRYENRGTVLTEPERRSVERAVAFLTEAVHMGHHENTQ